MNAVERKSVQEPIEAKLRELGWYVKRTKLDNERGWPDDQAHKNGCTLFIECKKPGEDRSPNQRRVHAELRAAGMTVIVAERWADVEPYVAD